VKPTDVPNESPPSSAARGQTISFDALNTGPLKAADLNADGPGSTGGVVSSGEQSPAPSPGAAFKVRNNRRRIIKLSILFLLIIAGLILVVMRHNASEKTLNSDHIDASQRFPTTSIPLGSITYNSSALTVQNAQTLSVNGQLNVNNSIVLTPTTQPSGGVTGQLYYDQGTNQLSYYDGQAFTSLLNGEQKLVTSFGGKTGDITTGNGLSISNNTLSNSGVLTLQGETGNITLSGGAGVVVNGTTLSNSGVLSLGGQGGNIALGNDLSISGGTLNVAAGIQNLTSGSPNVVVTSEGGGNYSIGVTVGGTGDGSVSSLGGDAGKLAVFTGVQEIEDSLVSQSGSTVTVTGNLNVTGGLNIGSALTLGNGGTGSTTPSGARADLGAAASGANSDITSLSNLTTALSVSQGGIGIGTLPTNGVLIGNGTNPIAGIVSGSPGQCLVSTLGSPTFQTCPGVSSINALSGSLTLAGASGGSVSSSGSTITINDATNAVKGLASFNSTNFTVSNGAVNTVQNINTGASPSFNALSLGNALTVNNGGTGSTTAPGARTNLGAAASGANSDITALSGLTTDLAVTEGGTGAATAAGARTNLGAAASGANSDITSLSGLTTALSVSQGGTGLTALTANSILFASSSSAIGQLATGASGQCLVSGGASAAPAWQVCPGSGGVTSVDTLTGNITIANTSGVGSTITIANAAADGATKGIAAFNSTDFKAVSGVVDTIQGIATTSTPTYAGLNLTAALTVSNGGTGAATAAGARTNLGAAASGANSDITSLSGLTTALAVGEGGTGLTTLTANGILYASNSSTISQLAVGTSGQCLISNGASSAPGFQTCPGVNSLDGLTGAITMTDSTGTGSAVTIQNAKADGSTLGIATFDSADFASNSSGLISTIQGISTTSAPSFGGLTLTNPLNVASGGIGMNTLTADELLYASSTTALGQLPNNASGQCLISNGASNAPTFQSCPGATSVTSLDSLTGGLTIANSVGAGATITINDARADGSTKGIAAFNSTDFKATTGIIDTIQNISTAGSPLFAQLQASSSQATQDMLDVNNLDTGGVGNLLNLQINGTSEFRVNSNGSIVMNGTVNGQTIGTSTSFTGNVSVGNTLSVSTITPSGGNLSIGNAASTVTIQGNASTTLSASSGSNTTTIGFQSPTNNVNYNFATAAGGNYNICTTAGNCAGVGGDITGSGSINTLAMFTSAGAIGNSLITENGGTSTITISGTLAVNTITPSSALTIGSTGQNITLQGAATSLSATSAGVTNTLAFATPSGSNNTITVPNASGTVAVSTSGPLALSAAGNLTCPTCLTSGGGGGSAGVSSFNTLTGAVTLSNTTSSLNNITINSAKADGSTLGLAAFNATDFTATSGVVDTIQGIATTSTPTYAGLNLTAALTVSNGGTGAATAAGARTNLGAAASGANSDITSLSGLTTALAVGEGGTGLTTLTANGILYASNSSTIGQVGVGTSGQCLMSNGAGFAPTFQACPSTGGGVTGTGTAHTLAVFTGTGAIGNSDITDSSSAVSINSAVSFTVQGASTFHDSSASTTAFQVQGASDVLDVDTQNSRIGVDTSTPAYALDVNGNVNTNSGYLISGASINTAGTLSNVAYLNGNQTFTGTNTFKTTSSTALQVQNSSGFGILTANTSTNQVILGSSSQQNGSLVFDDNADSNIISFNAASSGTLTTTVTGAGTGSFGHVNKATDVGDGGNDNNLLACSLFTFSSRQNATATSMTIYTHTPPTGSASYGMSIYTGNGNQPTTLVANTSGGTLSSTAGANTLAISTSLTANTQYWLCANVNNATSAWQIARPDLNPALVWYHTQTYGSWPGSISNGVGDGLTGELGISVNYTLSTSSASNVQTVSNTGQVTVQGVNNNGSAFQVQDAAGETIFGVSTGDNGTVSGVNIGNGQLQLTGLPNPTGVTATVASGGSLPVTCIFYAVDAVDKQGDHTNAIFANSGACVTTDSSHKTVNISWNAVPGAASYTVYYSTTDYSNFVKDSIPTGTTNLSDNGTVFSTQLANSDFVTPQLFQNQTTGLNIQEGSAVTVDGGVNGTADAYLYYNVTDDNIALVNYNANGGVGTLGNSFSFTNSTDFNTNFTIDHSGNITTYAEAADPDGDSGLDMFNLTGDPMLAVDMYQNEKYDTDNTFGHNAVLHLGSYTDSASATYGASIAMAGVAVNQLADYAEYFPQATPGQLQTGDVVCLNSSSKAELCTGAASGDSLLGVVSTDPGFLGNNAIYNKNDPNATAIVSMMGQVPVHASAANGAIHAGDMLTVNPATGLAIKATSAGQTIGQALGNLTSGNGTIQLYIHMGYYDPMGLQSDGVSNGYVLQGASATLNALTVDGTATINTLNVTGSATVSSLTVTTTLSTANITVNGHIVTSGSTPTVTTGTAAGTGAVVAVTGTDTSGKLTLTLGSSAAAGNLANLTFAAAYSAAPNVVLTAGNNNAAQIQEYVTPTTTGFSLNTATNTGLAAGQAYTFYYHVIQ